MAPLTWGWKIQQGKYVPGRPIKYHVVSTFIAIHFVYLHRTETGPIIYTDRLCKNIPVEDCCCLFKVAGEVAVV